MEWAAALQGGSGMAGTLSSSLTAGPVKAGGMVFNKKSDVSIQQIVLWGVGGLLLLGMAKAIK